MFLLSSRVLNGNLKTVTTSLSSTRTSTLRSKTSSTSSPSLSHSTGIKVDENETMERETPRGQSPKPRGGQKKTTTTCHQGGRQSQHLSSSNDNNNKSFSFATTTLCSTVIFEDQQIESSFDLKVNKIPPDLVTPTILTNNFLCNSHQIWSH